MGRDGGDESRRSPLRQTKADFRHRGAIEDMSKHDPVCHAFGLNLAKHRRARKLSQEALAEKADLDRTYLSDIEREQPKSKVSFERSSCDGSEGSLRSAQSVFRPV